MDNINNYRSKYPISKSSVEKSKIVVTEKEGGGFYARYKLEYKVKAKRNASFRAYDLKLLTTWDDQMRLMSISEIEKHVLK